MTKSETKIKIKPCLPKLMSRTNLNSLTIIGFKERYVPLHFVQYNTL